MQILNITSCEYSSAILTSLQYRPDRPATLRSHFPTAATAKSCPPCLPKICLWLQRPGCRALRSLVPGYRSLWVTWWTWATLQVTESRSQCPPLPRAPAAPRLPLAPALQQGWQHLVRGAVEKQLCAWPKPTRLWAAAKRSWLALPDDKAAPCHRLPTSPATRQLWDKLHQPSENPAPSQGCSSGTLHHGVHCSPHGRETRASPVNQSDVEYICL